MLATSPISASNPAGPRQFAGAMLLSVIAFVFFVIVIAAVAIRGEAQRDAASVAALAGLAPYAIALAVAHGIVAHFAMSRNAFAQTVAYLFAVVGTIIATTTAIAFLAGFDPVSQTAHGIVWPGVVVTTLLAMLYASAAFLLRGTDSHTDQE